MVAEKINQAAELLADAWKKHQQLPQLPDECVPVDRSESYAMQDAMAERLGLAVAGWKLGMSASATMRQFNVTEPIPGRIFRECIHEDGAKVSAGDYTGPKVEPEFAVRLKSALPAKSEPYARDEIVQATDSILLCLEIADNRLFMDPPDPLPMIADNGGFAAYVVGPVVDDWQNVNFATVPVDLIIDGEVAAPGLTGDFRVDPIDVVLWTANNLSGRGHGLAAGDLISTGSATVPTLMNIGSEAIGRFEGLGEVRVTFTP
jgi:2-keto-4-pentenoate hydratase